MENNCRIPTKINNIINYHKYYNTVLNKVYIIIDIKVIILININFY